MVLQQVCRRKGKALNHDVADETQKPAPAQDSPRGIKFSDRTLATVFSHLTRRVENDNPEQFRLPQDIRQFFLGVTVGPLGEYLDTETARVKLE